MKVYQNETKTHCFTGDITIEEIFEALYAGQMLGWFMMLDSVFLTDDRELKVTCLKRTEVMPEGIENGIV